MNMSVVVANKQQRLQYPVISAYPKSAKTMYDAGDNLIIPHQGNLL